MKNELPTKNDSLMIRLYNTVSRRIEDFTPIDERLVKIYSCGPTVYDVAHIGNFRYFIFVDFLKEFLKFSGYPVLHVSNITDVDDKILKRCQSEKKTLEEITQAYKELFQEDMKILSIEPPDIAPTATQHIQEMVEMIEKLISKSHAYVRDDGSVFFSISTFTNYGKLSRIDFSQMKKTDRVMKDSYSKTDVRDFALWKAWKPEDGEIFWNSPWGKGRPGWHIECSAMSMKYLGNHFDIHCGGVDLIFPHHENEIAQSICAAESTFVNYWVHCEHLLVNRSKMSKSLGNFYTISDLLSKGYSPSVIRFFLMSMHYRQKLNLTFSKINSLIAMVEKFREFRKILAITIANKKGVIIKEPLPIKLKFIAEVGDDLNISGGLKVLFTWMKEVYTKLNSGSLSNEEACRCLEFLRDIDSIFKIIFMDDVNLTLEEKRLIKDREGARVVRDWKKADDIRQNFLNRGIQLEDTQSGTIIKRIHIVK